MGLAEMFAEIIEKDRAGVASYSYPPDTLLSVALKLLAAVCKKEGHKSVFAWREELDDGWHINHSKCLRCGAETTGRRTIQLKGIFAEE